EKVSRRGVDAVQIQVVEPVAQLRDAALDVFTCQGFRAHEAVLSSTSVTARTAGVPVNSCTYASSSAARCADVCSWSTLARAALPIAIRSASGISFRYVNVCSGPVDSRISW